MILDAAGRPLRLASLPVPKPAPGQILVRVGACGVCRTDLHIVDGELANPKLPLVLGHEIAGTVWALGASVNTLAIGQRVGIPWLGFTCGRCRSCGEGRENLCDQARFTGYQIDGGYAEYAVADARYCFGLPEGYSFQQAAPLLCAGMIGYRTLRLAGEANRLGLYGFGAAAHIIIQIARYQGRQVYAFSRPGDEKSQSFARELGAVWAGDCLAGPPEELDAAIIFAPVGTLVPAALRALAKGGTVVCAGIHMSDIPSFPYEILWQERCVRSVANLTRQDGEEFLRLAARIGVRAKTAPFALERAQQALDALRQGIIDGAAVLVMPQNQDVSKCA